MLTSQTLERVSNSYRRGYQDGYYDTRTEIEPEFCQAFSKFDYDEGLLAGWNDKFWSVKRRNLSLADVRDLREHMLEKFKEERGINP